MSAVRALRRRKQHYTSLREIRCMVAEESKRRPIEDVEECV
jgi:hypothetical protein